MRMCRIPPGGGSFAPQDPLKEGWLGREVGHHAGSRELGASRALYRLPGQESRLHKSVRVAVSSSRNVLWTQTGRCLHLA